MMVGAFFSFWGYLPSFCRRHTQSYFSSWVYRLTSASLYPRFSLVVGICIAFCFPIPTLFFCCGYLFDICRRYDPIIVLFFGYIASFPLCYTQSSIFSWV